MDNPLVKLGWKPIKHEPTGGKDVPNALCDYLAENPRLSFFVTDDTPLTDQLGNPLKIERWIAKKKTPEGSWQHTYIEFDGRMREFVHAQSSRWYMPEKELGDLDPEHFIRTVNYFEQDDMVAVYVRNEDQIGKTLDINFGDSANCMDVNCKCTVF